MLFHGTMLSVINPFLSWVQGGGGGGKGDSFSISIHLVEKSKIFKQGH